jgi:hypothetical protein
VHAAPDAISCSPCKAVSTWRSRACRDPCGRARCSRGQRSGMRIAGRVRPWTEHLRAWRRDPIPMLTASQGGHARLSHSGGGVSDRVRDVVRTVSDCVRSR